MDMLTENGNKGMDQYPMNYHINDDEMEINLVSLFAALLRSWKVIILAGVIGCLLGTAFFLVRHLGNSEARAKEEEAYERSLANYEGTVGVYKASLEAAQTELDECFDYQQNSILMKIDPYKEAAASADLVIVAKDVSNTSTVLTNNELKVKDNSVDQLIQAYSSFLDYGISYQNLADQYGIKERYIRELMWKDLLSANGQIRVVVRHVDKAAAEEILEYILTAVMEQKKEFDTELPAHDLLIINKSVINRVDTGLMSTTEDLLNGTVKTGNQYINASYVAQIARINALNTRIEEIEKSMGGLVAPSNPTKSMIKNCLKFALLGLFAGLFLSAAWLAFMSVLTNRILDREQFSTLFRLPLLAEFPCDSKNPFNRLADGLLGVDASINPEDVKRVIANSIKKKTKNKTGKILIGAGREIKGGVAESLAADLQILDPSNTYKALHGFGNNPLTQDALDESDYVILLSQINKTKNDTVSGILDVARQYIKPVLGTVLYY